MADAVEELAGSVGREGAPRAAAGKSRLPAEFVYDGGQIVLELLSARAEEAEKRRFVERLRRLDARAAEEDRWYSVAGLRRLGGVAAEDDG